MPLTFDNNVAIQTFTPDPDKSQTNASVTGNYVFKKGSGSDVDITGWLALLVDPSADATYYFNADSGKTYPLRAGQDNLIMLGSLSAGETVTLVLSTNTASVQGM